MTRRFAIAAAACLAAILGATFLVPVLTGPQRGADAFAACRATAIAGGAASIGGPFELVDGDGAPATDADVLTKPSLVYFGYTFCPDVCPVDLDRNAIALDLLGERGVDAQGVFITVDPARDTPEVVRDYAGAFGMVGLTGTEAQVDAASKAYRTYYRRHEDEGDGFYLVDHSTQTYLVLPGRGFVEFFRRSDRPEEVAERAACFIANA